MSTTTFTRAKAHTRYTLADGTVVPSATTVIGVLGLNKQALIAWAARLASQGIDPMRYRDEAADAGSCAHEMVRAYWRGEEPDLSPYSQEQIQAARNSLQAFYKWVERKHIEPILVEQPMVSERHRFGGTPDVVAVVDGKLELLDWKTSAGLYIEHKIQVSAYYHMLKEHGYKVQRVRLIRIGREEGDSFEEHVVGKRDLAMLWKLFLHARAIYDLAQQLKGDGRNRG